MTAAVETPARFGFGANWQRFLSVLNADRIAAAEASLRAMLDVSSLAGRTFLDVGSGSGLFSLAAVGLGARRVHSFDFDRNSVECGLQLKTRFAPDADWTIEQGSVLDPVYLDGLGRFDVVYSWGVLHHTGRLWPALEAVADLVAPDGRLFLSIYNDQGLRSTLWSLEKRWYVTRPWVRPFMVAGAVAGFGVADAVRGIAPWRRYAEQRARGMSSYHDLIDWLGGYPFEVARPEDVTAFYEGRGFRTERLQTCGRRSGCNEFVFSAPARHDVSAP
jgi:2-polyprenyl-6-hydroxyphenyl methylase/3-demethylubiquinone-9 3-methyltransferase